MSTVQEDVLGGTPTSLTADAVTGLVTSAAFKAPCVTISTADLTLSGEQTVNGVAVVEDNRVLVNAQTAGADNGIYVVQTGAWYRAPDLNSSDDVVKGTQVRVTDGNNPGIYVVTTSNPIALGTTSLAFALDTIGLADLSGYLTIVAAAAAYQPIGDYASPASDYATLASPIFTGTPAAPTPAALDNDTSIATTAYVQGEVSPYRDPFLYDQYGAY